MRDAEAWRFTSRRKLMGEASLPVPVPLVDDALIEQRLDGDLTTSHFTVRTEPGQHLSLTQLVRGDGRFAGRIDVHVAANSTVAVQTLITGGELVRSELHATLDEGATLTTSGLTLGRDRQHADQHLEIVHAGANASSTQLFRNIVDDRARAIFTGLVTVDKDVRGTDADQSIRTLLLSETASVVARPWLEIHNEEVKAAHGAAIGQLDDESLFYLRSRGLTEAGARRLLTHAFAGEVLATVPERFRKHVAAVVTEWLA